MEVKHIEGYDCIDDNLRILLKDKNVDIRRIFNKLWYFKFNKNSDNIGKGLMCINDNKYEELRKNFNIDYEIYENKDRNKNINLKKFGKNIAIGKNQIDEIIKIHCNNDNIIVLEVNTFDYEYDKGFQKYVGTHSCVITEEKDGKAKIIDIWYKLYNKEIQYENLLNAITRIIILNISNIKEKEFEADELMDSLLDEKSINEMKIFFHSLNQINLNEEYLGLDYEMVFKAPIDKGLRKVIMNRQRFAYYLYYVSEKTNNSKIRELGECIFVLSMNWIKLRSILVQTYFLDKTLNIKQIDNLAQSIIEKELKIKKELSEVKW